MKNPAPGEGPRPTTEFERFEHALKRVLTVSKKELDARLAAQRASKQLTQAKQPKM